MFEVSRRDLIIGAAGAAAAFGLDRPIAFIGAAQAQTIPAAPGFKSNKVGDLEVISLYDGMWEKAHDENFIKGVNVEQTKTALKAAGLTDAFVSIPFTLSGSEVGERGGAHRYRDRRSAVGRRRVLGPRAWRPRASTPRR